MRYRYDVRSGVNKIKTKTTFAISGIILILGSMGISLLALSTANAAKGGITPSQVAPMATGSIGWSNSGAPAADTFDVHQSSTCTPPDVTGNWKLDFSLVPNSTQYDPSLYDLSLSQIGQNVTGTGQYPDPGPNYTFAWNAVGTVSGTTINLTDTYYNGAPGTIMNMTGTVAPDGTMSGTWNDNYLGETRSGLWKSVSGSATTAGCNATGTFTYSDPTYNYTMSVQYANIDTSTHTAWFAGQETSGNFASPGAWIFIKVVDNGQPGVGHDQIWGEGGDMDQTTALFKVANKIDPLGGPFTISSGNLIVH